MKGKGLRAAALCLALAFAFAWFAPALSEWGHACGGADCPVCAAILERIFSLRASLSLCVGASALSLAALCGALSAAPRVRLRAASPSPVSLKVRMND